MNAYSSDFVQDIEVLSGFLADMLSKLDGADSSDPGALAPGAFILAAPSGERRKETGTRPSLPDPRLVRRIIRQRQFRARYFPETLFADPAWDMLLDLTAATAEHARVSVTSLCHASGVPPTTALRWIGELAKAGLVQRQSDSIDRRRAFIVLTDAGVARMARYFQAIGPGGMHLV